jgi:Gpi18-like mannosyltransferase
MFGIATLLPIPVNGIRPEFNWSVFWAWDSYWYERIAILGYDYANDGQQHAVAFFPLFPLLIKGLIYLGIPFNIVGTFINNLAFLGALLLIYGWIAEVYNLNISKWTIAFLVWCPLSIYGTVIYTEGLFLLLTTATLRAFEKKQYFLVAIFGSLTTACRVTGLAIVPALLLTSILQKRALIAYLSSLSVSFGLLLYMLYCGITFQQPIAFILVQKAWQPIQDYWGQGWIKMFAQITVGSVNWNYATLVDFSFPAIFLLICCLAYWLASIKHKLGNINTQYCICSLILVWWLVAGRSLLNLAIVFGGFYLLWLYKEKFSQSLWLYGLFSFIIIFSTGRTASAERYVYGIVTVAIALGILFHRYPRIGYLTIGFFGLLLTIFSIQFAQRLWVA